MDVGADGSSNLVVKARGYPEKTQSVAGASLTGVPVNILHRDNGYNFEIYANGRLLIRAERLRDPKDQAAKTLTLTLTLGNRTDCCSRPKR